MIKVDRLGKKYQIHPVFEKSLREEITQFFKRRAKEEFWALQDVSFEIKTAETIGLIGSNGSGKSTLLKLLAQVAWPTTGRIELGGRVGALLEVGTGFHLDLTGRENIYLAGAILGMHRKEIKLHFDEIIAFSGVELFLDTPVKHYSSGMFLRLAFSVMAHLKSEILIVDEIIGIGDQEFQKKCLLKMEALAEAGRTIILVSHQLEVLASLCTRVFWLEKGILVADGEAELLLERYKSKAALHENYC